MGFSTLTSAAFASTTGFTSTMMYAWATTTIDTYAASALGFVAVFYKSLIAGAVIICIVGFAFVALRMFNRL